MKAYSILIVQLLLYILAAVLAMNDVDYSSWHIMNLSVALGCLNSISVWFSRRKWLTAMCVVSVKAYIILNATYSWWTFTYDQTIVWEGLRYFWGLSPVLLAAGIMETAVFRKK